MEHRVSSAKLIILTAILALSACSGQERTYETDETVTTRDFEGEPGDPLPKSPTQTEAYDGPIPRPIMVGSDGPQMDACGTYAEVANLDPQGDNYLSVRDAPSTATKERDRLDPGQGVSVCDSTDGWVGIVYSKTGEDCGTGSPVDAEQPYPGTCAQGWVDERFVEMIAG